MCNCSLWSCMCVCVCVWERERESVCVCDHFIQWLIISKVKRRWDRQVAYEQNSTSQCKRKLTLNLTNVAFTSFLLVLQWQSIPSIYSTVYCVWLYKQQQKLLTFTFIVVKDFPYLLLSFLYSLLPFFHPSLFLLSFSFHISILSTFPLVSSVSPILPSIPPVCPPHTKPTLTFALTAILKDTTASMSNFTNTSLTSLPWGPLDNLPVWGARLSSFRDF